MMMGLSKALLFLALGFIFMKQTDGACKDKWSCEYCASSRTWSGARCRWCPESQSCHTLGSPRNSCSRTENIVYPGDCVRPKPTEKVPDRETEVENERTEKPAIRPVCQSKSNCESCTSAKSWSGTSCRWCPRTKSCHAFASPRNKCRRTENIVNPGSCVSPKPTDIVTAEPETEARPVCQSNSNCESCTSAKSCRWCPPTESCHAFASPLNLCHAPDNIKNPKDCPVKESVPDGVDDYSPDKAYKLAKLSEIAYSKESVIKNTLSGKYTRVKTLSKSCPGATFQCAGFAAVSHSDNMIVVVFRGSQDRGHAFNIFLKSLLPPTNDFPAGGKVMPYFRDVFDLIWKPLKSHTYQLIKDYPSYKVYVTGHSLGGAVASLVSTAIVYDGATSNTRTVLYTFGQPRTGNYDYATKHNELVQASWRVVHYSDVVPHLPPCARSSSKPIYICARHGLFSQGPYHHGTEIFYQRGADKSNYKKCLGEPQGEDIDCSNGLMFSDRDHLNYLGVEFS